LAPWPHWSIPFLAPVLPGPEQAGPPFQQKYTAIWQKLTANSYFKKFRYFSTINDFFLILIFETKTEFFPNFNSFFMFACSNIFKSKFRYFSTTFG
jgi:hypothetical protein